MGELYKRVYKKDYTSFGEVFANWWLRIKGVVFSRFFQVRKIPVPVFFCLIISFVLVTFFSGFYFFIKTHEEFAANFADYTLRPIIGGQATISLEALFFNLEDHVNQIKYSQITSQNHPLTNHYLAVAQSHTLGASISAVQNPEYTLEQIPPVIISSSLQGEGVWSPLYNLNDKTLLAATVFRPDPTRPYAVVNLVKMNMEFLNLGAVAGLEQPGGRMKPGPGVIPVAIQKSNNLIAGFNGGFQQKDGYYGMIVSDTTYLPLVHNAATLLIRRDEPPTIVHYIGQNLGNDILAIRQNGPMLIENSQIVTSSTEWNMQTWGLTTTNSMYTWRSGIGVTKEGSLIYACGPSLVPETLAKSLLAAGAVDALQLDINPIWVRFFLYNVVGNGQYDSHPLVSSMVNGGEEYLRGYQKDFFYVYKKQ